MQPKYINPFTDFGFKRLFGEEANKDILIDFLNELLREEEEDIVDITYLNPEQLGRSSTERRTVFDIYCENAKGEKFIVEMQKAKQDYFKERSVFYSTFPIREQAERGEWNFDLKAIYTIGILDFVFDEDKDDPDKLFYRVKLSDIDTHEVFYDKLTFMYIEMPKFTKTLEECETHFDRWLYVLKNLEMFESYPEKLQERIFKKLFGEASLANMGNKELVAYEDSLKVYRDNMNTMRYAIREATKEAAKEAMARGLEQGYVDVAKKMKGNGIDIKMIAQCTGLTIDEVNSL